MPASSPYSNRGLFTCHVLDELLPAYPEWEAARGEAAACLAELSEIYQRQREVLPTLKEPQLEERWIRKVLGALGLAFDVQPTLPTDSSARTLSPDYALFAGEDDRLQADEQRRQSGAFAYYERVGRIGDAKRWGADFGVAERGGRSPRQQLTEYLHLTRVDWGFLTDGRRWRLVHRSDAGRVDRSFEVDLVAALESGDVERFLYFYLLFGAPALRRSPDSDLTLLDRVHRESRDYARAVGQTLGEAVYEALGLIANAFVVSRTDEDPPDPELLRNESLTLLYRLLFLLYAEHRRLLPVDSDHYRRYSLTSLARDLARDLDQGAVLRIRGPALWGRLLALFDVVDRGDVDLGVPAYNGGLFSAREHPFLSRAVPGDRLLARAIDLLTRTTGGRRQTIDYRDLSIRHLGGIYEGLLEYRLEIASEDKAVVPDRRGGGERYASLDPRAHAGLPEARIVRAGTAYLVMGRDERRVTGSFYTPDAIAEHVVAETLAPLVAGRSSGEILRLRVVDPAMGSGHFLLEAVDFLARAYGEALRAEGSAGVEGGGQDDALVDHRRVVAERCIYGVDLNPMAVELAKLALWLRTMARGRPLTFLNRNLKPGNAILGSRAEQVGEWTSGQRRGRRNGNGGNGTRQLNLFVPIFSQHLPKMVDGVLQILERETRSLADVEVKEICDRTVERIRAPFVALADYDLAALFDDADGGRTRPDFSVLVSLLHTPNALVAHPEVSAGRSRAQSKRFFHWEMMFPEVFYEGSGRLRKDPGFDAVVGNPPWIRQESIAADKAALKELYSDAFRTAADAYVYFVARGMELLAPRGRLGMVLPNKWLRSEYGEALRSLLLERGTPESLTDFGHAPVFPDADTFPCLLVVRREVDPDASMRFSEVRREQLPDLDLQAHVRTRSHPVPVTQLRREAWALHPPEVERLLEKIRTVGTPLGQLGAATPYRGVVTGLNDAFLIDDPTRRRLVEQDPGCASIVRKFLRGRDVDRWAPLWGGEWMIFARRGIEIERYPSVLRHLKTFRSRLEPKPAGHAGPWGGRKAGSYQWYEIQDAVDYYESLDRPKIVYPQIQFHSRFAWDDDGYYLNDKAFFVTGSEMGLVGVLNSSLLWWYMWYTAPHMKDETYALHDFYMTTLPVLPGPEGLSSELVALTRQRHEVEDQFLAWLRVELGVPRIGRRLRAFGRMDAAGVAREIRKEGVTLDRAGARSLEQEHDRATLELAALRARAHPLEAALHAEVERLFGIDDDDRGVLRRHPVPRDPAATGTDATATIDEEGGDEEE